MSPHSPLKLSVGVALDSLDDIAKELSRLQHEASRLRITRNNFIRNAADSGVKQSILMRRAKLSRQQITTIVNSAPEAPLPEWTDA